MSIYVYIAKTEFFKEIEYTVDLFFSTYGINYILANSIDELIGGKFSEKDILFVYSPVEELNELSKIRGTKNFIYIVNNFDNNFDPNFLKKIIQQGYNTLYPKDGNSSLPVPFGCNPTSAFSGEEKIYYLKDTFNKEYPGITYSELKNNFYVHTDLFGSAYYFLSLREELVIPQRDKHNRFLAHFSSKNRMKILNRPIVNEYFGILYELIRLVAKKGNISIIRKCFWPNNRDYAVCLTHDVDIISFWFLYFIFRFFQILKQKNFNAIWRMMLAGIITLLKGKNPTNSFIDLINSEKKFGFKSSFYFIVGKPSVSSLLKSDITYNVHKRSISNIVRLIQKKGFEVGLHGSYNSFADYSKLKAEKNSLDKILGQTNYGVRQHFLRFDPQKTWDIQTKIGFLYDTTLGYADVSGYRSAFAFPFYSFDEKKKKRYSILELPLTVMDRSFSKYQRVDISQIKKITDNFLSNLKKFNGLFTFLWHNHTGEEFGFIGYKEIYNQILERISLDNAFVTSGRDIALWWISRGRVKLIKSSHLGDSSLWEYESFNHIDNLSFLIFPFDRGKKDICLVGAKYEIIWGQEEVIVHVKHLVPMQKVLMKLGLKEKK